MSETKINVRLLRRIQKAVVEHAAHFDMNDWGARIKKSDVFHEEPPETDCGTVACIGGFAVLLSDGKNPPFTRDVARRAAALLGLDYDLNDDGLKGNKLFYVHLWPAKFRDKYYRVKRNLTRARVAADRIDWFIKTNGAE